MGGVGGQGLLSQGTYLLSLSASSFQGWMPPTPCISHALGLSAREEGVAPSPQTVTQLGVSQGRRFISSESSEHGQGPAC